MRNVAVFLVVFASACGPVPPSGSSRSATAPAAPSESRAPDGLPQPIREAFRRLDHDLTEKDRATIRSTPPEDMINYHFGLGMYVRNEYGLWRGSPLQAYFLARGVRHPDDMSGVLLDAYRLYLRGEQVKMDFLIAAAPSTPELEAFPELDSIASP